MPVDRIAERHVRWPEQIEHAVGRAVSAAARPRLGVRRRAAERGHGGERDGARVSRRRRAAGAPTTRCLAGCLAARVVPARRRGRRRRVAQGEPHTLAERAITWVPRTRISSGSVATLRPRAVPSVDSLTPRLTGRSSPVAWPGRRLLWSAGARRRRRRVRLHQPPVQGAPCLADGLQVYRRSMSSRPPAIRRCASVGSSSTRSAAAASAS